MENNNNTCQAIKRDNGVCGKRCRDGLRWCGLHARQAAQFGEGYMDLRIARRNIQQANVQNGRVAAHNAIWVTLNDALRVRTGIPLGARALRNFGVSNTIREPHRTYFLALFPRINALIEDIYAGADDYLARTAAIQAEIMRDAPQPVIRAQPADLAILALGGLRVPPPVPRINRELARFAADKQNVHTEAAVKQTKDIIDRVLRIAVPDEYKSPKLKTMAEIIAECPLSKQAAQQFAVKYCMDEDIYGYGPGIYARVCDSVWQFIRNSPDKADLCKIMGVEITDSIGMCAQGNLTRLCNILAGYMEGVNTEPVGEQLQRRMAALMEVENAAEREAQGRALLQELAVPDAEWQPWLEALA